MSTAPGARDPHFAAERATVPSAPYIDEPLACPSCGIELTGSPAFETFRVCPGCHRHFPLPIRERLRLLIDPGSFRESNAALISIEPLVFRDLLPVSDRLVEAAERVAPGAGLGVNEAVVTGSATIAGHEAIIIALDHALLGATIGPVAGEKILLAMETAATRRAPLIALCAAGGARTQEGLLGLAQAPKIAAAAARLHRTGVPFVSVLAHPAIGMAWSALASQADIILAEPGARVGSRARPPGADQDEAAEDLLAGGVIDTVVDRAELRQTLSGLLGIFAGRGEFRHRMGNAAPANSNRQASDSAARRPVAGWERAGLARHPQRPQGRDYIARLAADWHELHGDRTSGDDSAVTIGLGRIDGAPVAIVAESRDRLPGAVAYRKLERLLRLAGHLELPVVALIDSPSPGQAIDEASGSAQSALAQAKVSGLLALLPIPVVSVVIGAANGMAGLVLGGSDRLLMQEHAVFTVGAERTERGQASPLAASRTLTASECQRLGVVDGVVPEPMAGAHADPELAARALGAAIDSALAELSSMGPRHLLDARAARLRALGHTTPEAREAARSEVREVQELQRALARSLGDLRERFETWQFPQIPMPQWPDPIRERVPLDPSGLPGVEWARSGLLEGAAWLSARRGAEASVPDDDANAVLSPAQDRARE